MCVCVGGDSVTLVLDFDNLSAAGAKLPSSASFHNEDFKDFRSKYRLSQCFPAQEEFPYSVGGGPESCTDVGSSEASCEKMTN